MHLADLSAEAAARIASGTLTAEALARALLERIEEREPAIGAWQFLDPDAVLAQARACDEAKPHGPLHGVPVAVKDVIDTADMPTTYGSAAYAGHRPASDASCVALSRAAGAVMMGKTVSTEFAALAPGKTRNPRNGAHTPGGSSSGSAAAVAAGMVPLAFGTQTAGSIIRPASFCGVVGYKPSFGVIERAGVKTLSGSLDTVGVMARDVRDAAFFVAVLGDRPGLAVAEPLPALRVGLYRTATWDRAEPTTVAAIERTAEALSRSGFAVEDVPASQDHLDLLDVQTAIMGWETYRALAFERLYKLDQLAPKTQDFLRNAGSSVPLQDYDEAQRRLPALARSFEQLFEGIDVLLTPAAPGEAPAGLESTGDALFNRVWTALHLPCVCLPAGDGPSGLPVGVQIVGRRGDDAHTLACAAAVEAVLANG